MEDWTSEEAEIQYVGFRIPGGKNGIGNQEDMRHQENFYI